MKLLLPFGIYKAGDVIEVRDSVADLWIKQRMVREEESSAKVTPPRQESASFYYHSREK